MPINPDVTYADLQNMSDEEYSNFYSELKKLSETDREVILKKVENSMLEKDKVANFD